MNEIKPGLYEAIITQRRSDALKASGLEHERAKLGKDDVKQLEFPASRVWGADNRGPGDTRGLDVGPSVDLAQNSIGLVVIPSVLGHQGPAAASKACRATLISVKNQ